MSINILEPAGIYRVTQRFTDCRGTTYESGQTFTYHSRSYWAYDGGIMLDCAGMRIDFLEGENADLITNFSAYVEKIGQSEAPIPQLEAKPLVAQQAWAWWEIAGAVGLVFGSMFIVFTQRARFTAVYVSAWIVLLVAVLWCAYALMRWRGRK